MKGFTLVELLVAMAITLVVTAAALSIVQPLHDVFQVQPEWSDLHQRTRVGVDALHRDLRMAGAGMYAAGDVGPLHQFLAPVMPYRAFGGDSDSEEGAFFRADAISLLFVPSTPAQTTLAMDLPAGGLEIEVVLAGACPAATASQVCGLAAGDEVLVFDRTGTWDVFSIDRAAAGTPLALEGPLPARGFAAGSNVTAVRAVTYALKPDQAAGAFQLVRSEGDGPAQPVLDHVVKLEFSYWGDPEPPRLVTDDEAQPRASYGPAPPAVGEARGDWPEGENCTFAVVDGGHVPRLAALGPAGSLVEMPAALLTDGPWCPGPGDRNRFDADLLRIRRVRFVLRVQAAVPALRGPAGRLFANAGLARAAGRMVPDLEIPFDVAPRNMNQPGLWNAAHE